VGADCTLRWQRVAQDMGDVTWGVTAEFVSWLSWQVCVLLQLGGWGGAGWCEATDPAATSAFMCLFFVHTCAHTHMRRSL